MAIDIGAALAKSANAIKFSDRFVSGYTSPAFGARSKAEIDLLVFTCLIEARGPLIPKHPSMTSHARLTSLQRASAT
jgi:hypothetical protein